MRSKLRHILFLFTLPVLCNLILNGQEIVLNNPELYREQIKLVSDRTIYASGEQIHFKAYYCNNNNLEKHTHSKVMYLEIIKPDGTPVAQEKYQLEPNGCNGIIAIPGELLTGNYYLKAYTKWMRNFEVSGYSYNQIQVYNPENNILYTLNNEKREGLIPLDFLKYQTAKGLTVNTDKAKYLPREKVQVSIQNTGNYNTSNYAVSVVKKGTKKDKILNSNSSFTDSYAVNYFPEIYGVSLSGKIRDLGEDKQKSYQVNISSLNGLAYFSSFNTLENDMFCFNLPNTTGSHELFLSVNSNNPDIKIEIDNAFCEKPIYIDQPCFNPDSSTKELAWEIAKNKQISEVFMQNHDFDTLVASHDYSINFYGSGNKMLYFKDYIELPYLEDFLFELVPEILVRYHKKEPSISFHEQIAFSNFPVLLLVDNIVIYDLNAFLKIIPQKLKSIEIIDHGYVIGKNKFNGILSVVSNNSDMAGIDLPPNAMFLNFELFNKYIFQPDIVTNTPPSVDRVPNRRNCLYWNPELKCKPQQESGFSFYTCDIPGEYQIIVQSYNSTTKSLETFTSEFEVE